MKLLRKNGIAAACLFLIAALLAGLFLMQASATAADDQEKELLGTLSASYEASGPGTISSGEGDSGGKSYGSYQLSSAYDKPKHFFEWCQKSDDTYYQSIGNRLHDAYYTNGAGYGPVFDAEWKALAAENAAGFEQAQRNYIKLSYYDPVVRQLEANIPGFFVSNYSIALRNVIWSRSVQHGSGGAVELITDAFNDLGGFANQSEAELINAIYELSGYVRPRTSSDSYYMSGSTAEKYGVSGMVLHYYRGNSGDVQLGVYIRLRINEPADAQQMLADYGYTDAPLDEAGYQFSPVGNTNLAITIQNGSLVLNAPGSAETYRLYLTYYASGCYTIATADGSLRLTADSSGRVTLAAPSTSNNQMWKLARYNSGFSVQNRGTSQYLSASSTSAGGQIRCSSTAMQWQTIKDGASWSLDGASYPTYSTNLQVGNSNFPFLGTLRCTYPIQTVKVQVLNASGKDAFTPATASGINSTSYDLSRLDSKVAFSRLGAGAYTMVLTATSSAPKDNTYVLESPFYVSDGDYLLTFDAQGGTSTQASRRVAAGQVYGTLPTASKDGYVFVGWFTDPTGGSQVTENMTAPAKNQTLYARYEKALTYRFVNYDGTVISSGQLTSGQKIPAPTVTPAKPADGSYYYVFTGWQGYTEGMTISADVTFTAQFEAKPLDVLPEMTTDVYTISGSYLRAIPLGTKVSTVLDNLVPNEFITISKGSAKVTDVAATGMTVTYAPGGETQQTLTLVVTGDVNGDGKCTITDLVQIQSYLLNKQTFSDAALQAADLNGDGKCTITDLVQVQSYLLGRLSITPR